MSDWTPLRHHLHKHPELSGAEEHTANYILKQFSQFNPDRSYRQLGGQGLAFCFDSHITGPNVLFRSELDALPIHEINPFAHCSIHPGIAHKCGHDGHMAILMALAEQIVLNPPKKRGSDFFISTC